MLVDSRCLREFFHHFSQMKNRRNIFYCLLPVVLTGSSTLRTPTHELESVTVQAEIINPSVIDLSTDFVSAAKEPSGWSAEISSAPLITTQPAATAPQIIINNSDLITPFDCRLPSDSLDEKTKAEIAFELSEAARYRRNAWILVGCSVILLYLTLIPALIQFSKAKKHEQYALQLSNENMSESDKAAAAEALKQSDKNANNLAVALGVTGLVIVIFCGVILIYALFAIFSSI